MIGRCVATYYENRSSEFVRQIQATDDATNVIGEECEVFKRETDYTGCLQSNVLSFNDRRRASD